MGCRLDEHPDDLLGVIHPYINAAYGGIFPLTPQRTRLDVLTRLHYEGLRTFLIEGTQRCRLTRESQVSLRVKHVFIRFQVHAALCLTLRSDNISSSTSQTQHASLGIFFYFFIPAGFFCVAIVTLPRRCGTLRWVWRPLQILFCVLQGHKSSLHGW